MIPMRAEGITHRPSYIVAMFIAAWLFAANISFAQSTGTVRGTVKDPSGAIISGAKAVLTNGSTHQQLHTITADAGTYSFIFLPPGNYSLKIEQSGFSSFVRNDITVDVAGVFIVDAALQLGKTTDTVTVAEAPEELQTGTSDLGHVVDNTMMNAVPLSSRNFTQILALSPGVTANVIDAGATGRNSVNISANGARPWDNNVVLNGLNADNPMSQGFDDAPDKTGVPVPSPDAIEEFKVQTGLYDAEFGKQGGGTVNMVTKSGGAELHGSAFEFFRNTALDANSFFQNASGAAKPIFRQNQYGGTLGGPLVKDKVFFFLSYEGTNQANGISSSSNKTTFLPVVGDRTAQGLGAIYGGQTGVFGGAAIASNGSNINPVALALLNAKLPNGQYAIPSPQVLTSATTGYSAISAPAIFNENQIIGNGDVQLTDKQRLSLKTLYSRDPTALPFQSSTTVLGFGENDYHSNVNLSLSHTYTISPTVVNQIRAGYTRSLVIQTPVEPFSASSIGMTPPTALDGTPSIAINGLFNIGTNRNNSQLVRQQQLEVADTLNKVLGRHQIRIGGSVDPTRVKYSDLFAQRGEIVFQSFPDFLLGMSGPQNGTPYSNLSQTLAGNGRPAVYPSMNNFAMFVQDDFRVNDRLTLNLGLRYQFNGQAYSADGKISNWDFRLYPQNGPPPGGTLSGLVVPGNLPSNITVPAGVTKLSHNTLVDGQNWLGFSPRIGLAWQPLKNRPNIIMRMGYGIFYSAVPGTYSIGVSEQQPFYASVIAGGANNPNVTFQNPFPNVPSLSQFPLYSPVSLGSNPTVYPYDPALTQPRTQEYSGNIQAEVKTVVFQAGYVGSQTTNLVGFVPPNQAGLASPSNPIHGQTTNTLSNLLLRVPFIGFAPGVDGIGAFMNTYCTSEQACAANPYSGNPFWSRYNSFQFSATKRYSKGLSVSGAYTWSHAIDNLNGSTSGRQQSLGGLTGDFHNPAVGPSNFVRTNVFTGSYLYEIPKLSGLKGFMNVALNGWSLSGVVVIESGLPYSVTDSRGGTILGTNGSFAQFAPGYSPNDVALSSPSLNRYFNTSAFTAPPIVGNGTGLGNSPRNFLTGPGFWNADVAVVKNLPLRERFNAEFRTEFFNLFNHANFANPGSSLASPSSFGVVSSTVSAPRIIQLALRIHF
jgi:hypothetical protein